MNSAILKEDDSLAFEKEVLEALYLITGSLPSSADVTSSILTSEGEAIFFDSLYYPNETRRLMDTAETEELQSQLAENIQGNRRDKDMTRPEARRLFPAPSSCTC